MATIGVCTDAVVSASCTNYVVVDNITTTSMASFDWNLMTVLFFGILSMWIIGLKFGFISKIIKNAAKIR